MLLPVVAKNSIKGHFGRAWIIIIDLCKSGSFFWGGGGVHYVSAKSIKAFGWPTNGTRRSPPPALPLGRCMQIFAADRRWRGTPMAGPGGGGGASSTRDTRPLADGGALAADGDATCRDTSIGDGRPAGPLQ